MSETADEVLERLEVVVNDLAGHEPAALDDTELVRVMVRLRRVMDRQEALFARFAGAGHHRAIGAVDGAASTAAWLRHLTKMCEGDAKAAIECGAVSDLLRETGAAWRSGEIPTGAVRTIVAARVRGSDEQYGRCEDVFLDLARSGDLRNLRRATAHVRNLARVSVGHGGRSHRRCAGRSSSVTRVSMSRCTRPVGWCDAHHVTHWVEGGSTAAENLVLLCDRHHHVVHQPGWLVKFDGADLRVVSPDGHEVT